MKHQSSALLIVLLCIWTAACNTQTLPQTNKLVVEVNRGMFKQIKYVVDITGKTSRLFFQYLPRGLESQAEWSPDGQWVVFSKIYSDGPEKSIIFIMRTDGSDLRKVPNSEAGSYDPAWSPDGKQIAFYNMDAHATYTLNIECVRLGTECINQPILVSEGGYSPDWSPDGTRLVYEKEGNIIVVNLSDVNNPRNITRGRDTCLNPKWSPKSDQIVFSCYTGDEHDIFMTDADGSFFKNLTKGFGSSVMPSWSPDGSQITFVSDRDDDLGKIIGLSDTVRSNAIYIMESDGKNVRRLTPRSDENVLWYTWLP